MGAERGRQSLRGEILGLHDLDPAHAGDREGNPEWFNLAIANSDGVPIQEMDSKTARDNGFADMPDLFYRARRHAVDLNAALDDLLKELDHLS